MGYGNGKAKRQTATSRTRQMCVDKYLYSRPEELVTTADIHKALYADKGDKLQINAFRQWMYSYWVAPRTVEVVPRKGFIYHPEKPSEPEVKEKTVPKPLENSEGCSDPTAGKALQELEPELQYKAGELWTAETRSGESEIVLIIAATRRVVTVLRVYPEKRQDLLVPLRIFYCGKFYWTDPSEIGWRNPKSLMKNHHGIRTAEFVFIKQALGKYLGTTITNEVIKEVPKIKIIPQTVERQDPKLVQELRDAKAEIARLKEELSKAPKVEETPDILVLKTQLEVYREIFGRMYPERRTADES